SEVPEDGVFTNRFRRTFVAACTAGDLQRDLCRDEAAYPSGAGEAAGLQLDVISVSMRKAFVVLVLFLVLTASSATAPKITISTAKARASEHIFVKGSGFTPHKNISSHLRRPDGLEYPILPLYTDDKGEFTHDIDTIVLMVGVHDLWVIDDTTK